MTTINAGSTAPSTAGKAKSGYVIEAIIEGKLAWLVEPIPLERYTFTFDLEQAHVWGWDEHHIANTTRSCVWCGYFSKGGYIRVARLNDDYRAMAAADAKLAVPAEVGNLLLREDGYPHKPTN